MLEDVHCFKPSTSISANRIQVKGKFLYDGAEKFYVKGVTYGTFKPQQDGTHYPVPSVVENDFHMMASHGINCVRTYTVPPEYVLNTALQNGLKVMVGLPWEQHIAFLDNHARKKDIIRRVQEGVLLCKQHPAVLCFAIGNEIPAPVVRWYGKEKIEAFLEQLYQAVKVADPRSLVTYVNYPTTEYLNLNFLDFDCFNVYLETPEKLSAYIARLHNLAGNKPLVLAEIGLDSLRKGKDLQAKTLDWQIRTVFAKGCAGMFVFAWTDEWWRGGFDIEDWDFGIVDRKRNPKPALFAVSSAMQNVPFAGDEKLPFISVVVCSYNGATTIRDCLEGVMQLDYPNYEVIVVNDGSTDNTASIAENFSVHLISTSNQGLSSARNTGLHQAKGEIIAYIDDDAYPDPHWLRYLAYAYLHTSYAGIGGPNIAPSEDGPIAKCVANAPGGPVHVLISDEIAEHIPGCNMSFRKEALMEIGGFDPIYRTAGDDVDICWRIQKAGKSIGFHPSAVVWHHRRNSVKAYWKQQKGYGKAEALLEAKWPEKYNGFGHLAWAGRIYGNGFTLPIHLKKDKVFYGTWGTALFQSIYQPADGFLNALPLMPEWYLLSGILAVLGGIGFLWSPLLAAWPFFILSLLIVLIQAVRSASKNVSLQFRENKSIKYRLLIMVLHMLQPLARLHGRIKHGLRPWQTKDKVLSVKHLMIFRPQILTHWSEEWRSSEDWLETIEKKLIAYKTRVKRGGEFDRWDIEIRNSLFCISRSLLMAEEHGSGKQLLRFSVGTSPSNTWLLLMGVLMSITIGAMLDGALPVAGLVGFISLIILAEYLKETVSTLTVLDKVFEDLKVTAQPQPPANSKKTYELQDEEEKSETSTLRRILIKTKSTLQRTPQEASPKDEVLEDVS